MGIIDKTTYTLRCDKCGITEDASILDKGSNWGGSHWQNGTNFKSFTTLWSGAGKSEPKLVEAKCKNCGHPAEWDSRYGGF
ncbi:MULTISPECIES: hypothetical protein [Aeromonas]|uniref:hypothetical protein n=1 Tax=Aeromonas TaxID=642 RepID=UPI00192015D0|nr:hypothetical protein [Aeromonas jandaei]MBL0611325.1 hypothetical protein [Aeromonas jandaei]